MMFDHDGTPVRTGRAAANGTSLHYRAAGTGPAVVLLHGVPKTGYHWRHLVPKLTPYYTVVVPDLRGLGDSARSADGYDTATMSDDIAELMTHLGHETYAVAGEDWGAVIGYQLAARHRGHRSSRWDAESFDRGEFGEEKIAEFAAQVAASQEFRRARWSEREAAAENLPVLADLKRTRRFRAGQSCR